MTDIEKKLAEFNKKGLEENSSGGTFEVAKLKIVDVDTSMSGAGSKYDSLKKAVTKNGDPLAFIIFTFKVFSGQYKGEEFKWNCLLLNSKGSPNVYASFTADDGTEVLASELYDVIHSIKECDPKQWDDELLTPDKFMNKKLEIEIGKIKDEFKLNTARAKANYEEWKAKNDKKSSKKEEKIEEDLDLDEEGWDE